MDQDEKASGAWRAPEAKDNDDDDLNESSPNNTKNANGTQPQSFAERLTEAVSFLEQLRPNGPWVLTAITPDGPTITITAHSAAAVESFIREHDGKRNIYYSVNPTKGPVSKKASKADIAAVEYLLGDLDPKPNETAEQAKTRYLTQLESFEPKATALVDSGNGIQGLWRQGQAIDLSCYPTAVDSKGKPILGPQAEKIVADVEARSAALMVRLGAEAGTQNIDRILRLPGTINLPNKAKLKAGRVECPTRLIAFNGASYALDAFPLPEPNEPGSPEDGGHHARQEAEEDTSDDKDKLEWTIRHCDAPKGERSGHVWWVINELLRRNVPASAIVSTLLDHANKISAHIYDQPHPRQYAERQVAEAREQFKAKFDAKGKPLPESQWFGEKPMELPPALISGIFPQTGVATIGGQSGGGKSFHAIHLSLCLMPDCEQNFYIDKYRIKRKGGVLYLVLEGKASFHMRVTAAYNHMMDAQMEFGERWKIPFSWNTYSPSLFSEGPDTLLKIIDRDAAKMRKEFGVDMVAFCLDTMGLAAIYKKEDDAAQVQKVISDLGRMSEETGALAVNVDHYGKDQGAGLRGSSAKRAGADTVLACLVDRDKDDRPTNHRMVFEKIRDGEEGRIVPYRLKQVDMGMNEDGDRVTSCVVQWEVGRPMGTRGRKAPPKKTKTSVPLDKAIEEVGLPVEMEVLREAFYKAHGGTKHAANRAWNRAIEASDLELRDGKLDYGEGE
jgi:hypothetical protein